MQTGACVRATPGLKLHVTPAYESLGLPSPQKELTVSRRTSLIAAAAAAGCLGATAAGLALAGPSGSLSAHARGCDPNYRGYCVPRYPPDVDCKDIGYRTVRVTGRDVHRLDRDKDGLGCEPSGR